MFGNERLLSMSLTISKSLIEILIKHEVYCRLVICATGLAPSDKLSPTPEHKYF